MTRLILEPILQIVLIIPLAILLMNKRTKENYLRILFFTLIYIVYQIVLVLPQLWKPLNFIDSRWNWEGKIFAILFGITCYFAFKKYFSENDFFTFKQDKDNFKKTVSLAIIVIILATMIGLLYPGTLFNSETLAFQLTMPGIDEEIMFRGVLLGLLASSLREKILFLGNPAVVLTAILFGFVHALTLDKDLSISFDPIYFLHTGFGGYLFGWMTIKSRSILLATLSHGFGNFFSALVMMFK